MPRMTLRRLRARLRALLRPDAVAAELDDEIRHHIEADIASNLRRGLTPEEARRQALLAFGGTDRFREATREARAFSVVEQTFADVRYAVRALWSRPGFTVAAVAVLGIGMGAATAMFSVFDAVALAPLPYAEADRLVRLYQQNSPANRWGLSAVDLEGLGGAAHVLAEVGAVQGGEVAVAGEGGPVHARAGRATSGFFRVLRVPLAAGRHFGVEEDAPSSAPVVVVSASFADARLGGVENAVGRSIAIEGRSHVVVGVLGRGIVELAGIRADVWPSLRLAPPTRRGPFTLRVIARLAPGVTLEEAGRELDALSVRLFEQWRSSFQDATARITPVPLREAIVGDADRTAGVFMAAVMLVLLIAVANVANLTLARAAGRRREIGLRAALGSTRMRIARLLVVESLLVALLAALLGVALAAAGLGAIRAAASGLPRIEAATIDVRAFGVAFAFALASGMVIGAYPLRYGLGVELGSSLRSDPQRGAASRTTGRLRAALVVVEFALALPLLAGAGLLLDSFLRLQQVDAGFDPESLVAVRLSLPEVRYPDPASRLRFWTAVERIARETPGVQAAGLLSGLPPAEPYDVNNFDLVERPVPPGAAQPVSPWLVATVGTFDALGVRVIAGRSLEATDDSASAPVAVVSRTWAAQHAPERSAVGVRFRSGGCSDCEPTTVIGVVEDVKYDGLRRGALGVYVPNAQVASRSLHLLLRTVGAPAGVMPLVRERIAALDRDLPLDAVVTLDEQIHATLARPRRWATLLGAFAAVALLLAALGVFATMSYVVRQQRREIGVRLALGAVPAGIITMVVWRGMRLAAVGALLGLMLAIVSGRALRSLLFEVDVLEPITLAVVSSLLLGTALVACVLSARSTTRIHPAEALAAE